MTAFAYFSKLIFFIYFKN